MGLCLVCEYIFHSNKVWRTSSTLCKHHSPLWLSHTGQSRAQSEGSPCPRSHRSGRDPEKKHTCHQVVVSSKHKTVWMCSSRSPLRMRRGRWSRELPGTAWPPSHPQTGDCPPMSAMGETNQANKKRIIVNKADGVYRLSAVCPSSSHYLIGGEALILQRGRPLGRDAHFHVAERLPWCMQEHIAGGTERKGHRVQKKIQSSTTKRWQTAIEATTMIFLLDDYNNCNCPF